MENVPQNTSAAATTRDEIDDDLVVATQFLRCLRYMPLLIVGTYLAPWLIEGDFPVFRGSAPVISQIIFQLSVGAVLLRLFLLVNKLRGKSDDGGYYTGRFVAYLIAGALQLLISLLSLVLLIGWMVPAGTGAATSTGLRLGVLIALAIHAVCVLVVLVVGILALRSMKNQIP